MPAVKHDLGFDSSQVSFATPVDMDEPASQLMPASVACSSSPADDAFERRRARADAMWRGLVGHDMADRAMQAIASTPNVLSRAEQRSQSCDLSAEQQAKCAQARASAIAARRAKAMTGADGQQGTQPPPVARSSQGGELTVSQHDECARARDSAVAARRARATADADGLTGSQVARCHANRAAALEKRVAHLKAVAVDADQANRLVASADVGLSTVQIISAEAARCRAPASRRR